MKVELHVEVVHGQLTIDSASRAILTDAVLTWPDGPVTLTLERESVTRSARANSYYWGLVIKALATHTGYTPDEMHDILKHKFLPKDVAIMGNGEVVAEFVIGGSTRTLTIGEFYDYVERIRLWAFEMLDVAIPPADPEWRAHEVEQAIAEAAREAVAQ